MTAQILVTCDAVHPARTPPECRAFFATGSVSPNVSYREVERNGWTWVATPEGLRDICPSCGREGAQ